MLYNLLYSFSDQFSWLNVFKYQTFRAMLSFLLALTFALVFQPVLIRYLKNRGLKGQPIRADGPSEHQVKVGTPTMGGLVTVAAITFSTILLGDLTNKYVLLSLYVLLANGLLGFFDDWSKVKLQNVKGVSGPTKLFWQTLIAVSATVCLYLSDFPTQLTFPFFKDLLINLGIFFILFSAVVVVGTSNAVNLTDGLDGLAIGPVMTVATTYVLIAYLSGNKIFAEYLGISHIAGAGELTIVLSAVIAAGLGFLWYNTFPAQVFMGDIGALALGGLLGFVAVVVKHELVLIIAGGVFVVEALSVIIQRYYYKLTGKRVFRMAPIHHHFELKGWAEPKIIVRFWIVSIILALISLTTLKLR